MREVYQSNEINEVVEDTLEAKVREGARLMLAAALEEEVSAFLGRERYERTSRQTQELFRKLYKELVGMELGYRESTESLS